jgi:predicted MFS family arabinose efflux permease
MGCVGIAAVGIISWIPTRSGVRMEFPRPRDVFRSFRSAGMLEPVALAFLFAIAFSAPTSFLATVAEERGIADFSLYFTAWGLSGVAVRFIGGRWGDRLGQRQVLIPGFAAYAAGLIVVAMSASTSSLILAGILGGMAHGIAFPAVTSLAHSLAPPEYAGSAMALVTGTMDFGAAVNAFVVGPLASAYGYDIVFPIAAAAALAGCAELVLRRGRAGAG